MSDGAYMGTAHSQLERLSVLTDVVYGVALVLVVSWLPLPEESHATGAVWLFDLWVEYSNNIIAVIIGLAFTIIYWIRSNTLMTALDRTDGVHTGMTIASVFFFDQAPSSATTGANGRSTRTTRRIRARIALFYGTAEGNEGQCTRSSLMAETEVTDLP